MPDFDAIVVGSGISGGWAVKELAERGLKILLLERGPEVVHGKDYVGEHRPPWDFPFRTAGDRRLMERDYPVQSRTGALDEGSIGFFVNDRKHPYQVGDGGFTWIRGYHLGGRSLTWGRVTLRLGELNFREPAQDGQGIRWPIGYDDLKDWYAHVERFIGVSGAVEGSPVQPDGEFLPAFPLNCVEAFARENLRQAFDDRLLMPAPSAVLSREHGGRAACHFCGPCQRGCSTGSYFSTLSSTLPAAKRTGNVVVRTDAIVAALEYDPASERVTGARVIDAETGATTTYSARMVFLNASTLGTTHILLNSRSQQFPNGLANTSGAVGRYLMDHVMGPFVKGVFRGFGDREESGNRPTPFYIPRFQNVEGRKTDFFRGYGLQGITSRELWTRGFESDLLGAELKAELRKPGDWHMFVAGMGECLPYASNRAELDERHPDSWGLPQLKIHFQWGENEKRMWQHMREESVRTLEAAGADSVVSPEGDMSPGGLTIHEMGTARMGDDPRESVLNRHNQAHDVPNLFITDGSCMTASACQNPSLTYMALTARACDYAVDRLKAGTL